MGSMLPYIAYIGILWVCAVSSFAWHSFASPLSPTLARSINLTGTPFAYKAPDLRTDSKGTSNDVHRRFTVHLVDLVLRSSCY